MNKLQFYVFALIFYCKQSCRYTAIRYSLEFISNMVITEANCYTSLYRTFTHLYTKCNGDTVCIRICA